MKIFILFFCIALFGCGGEWVSGDVLKTSCSFADFFSDFMPAAHKPIKMASGNNGNNIYILDDFYNVHSYRRDKLYECAFDLEDSYRFSDFPTDVLFADGSFYVQDLEQLKSMNDAELCRAKDGVFAIYGNELAVGSNTGVEIWSINPCFKKGDATMQRTLALAATNYEYFAVEGISATPQSLAMIPKNGSHIYRDVMSSTPGNEKNFCSADRLAANNSGVYLLDKTCKKIGIYDNMGVWQGTINLSSVGISGALDIAPAEYPYIFVLHNSGVEKISMFLAE